MMTKIALAVALTIAALSTIPAFAARSTARKWRAPKTWDTAAPGPTAVEPPKSPAKAGLFVQFLSR